MLRVLSTKIAVTLQEAANQFAIVEASAHQTLHEKLGMGKVIARWVPKQLTDQTVSRVTLARERLGCCSLTLRKHAYSNILKILPPKNENFQIKNSDIFHNSAQNTDCGYSLEPPQGGGSNEYPQSMFFSNITKIMYTPVNPSYPI